MVPLGRRPGLLSFWRPTPMPADAGLLGWGRAHHEPGRAGVGRTDRSRRLMRWCSGPSADTARNRCCCRGGCGHPAARSARASSAAPDHATRLRPGLAPDDDFSRGENADAVTDTFGGHSPGPNGRFCSIPRKNRAAQATRARRRARRGGGSFSWREDLRALRPCSRSGPPGEPQAPDAARAAGDFSWGRRCPVAGNRSTNSPPRRARTTDQQAHVQQPHLAIEELLGPHVVEQREVGDPGCRLARWTRPPPAGS